MSKVPDSTDCAAVMSLRVHYVQVRYAHGRWVTVAIKATRATASTAAAAAYRGLLDTWAQLRSSVASSAPRNSSAKAANAGSGSPPPK
jgi:hypothetical protein